MARTHESAVQRIQVGVFGLLAVLLFVYIANMIVERVVPAEAPASAENRQPQPQPEKPKDEPLAELGVTPVVEEAPEAVPKAPTQPTP
jgi:hypothetical protein